VVSIEAGAVIVRILADSSALTAGLSRASGQMAAFGSRMSRVGMGMSKYLTLPIVAVGAVSIKMAADFETSMKLIQTQAGGSAKDVTKLSKSVLELATHAQHGPKELADSLYHLKSVGMSNVQAMNALKLAEEGASVGGSKLEETTNAIAGAWRTGIKGAQSFEQAMGTLNSIVGAGNLRMEDLNQALGTGILVSAKTFGVSLTSVGAALALFTSQGMPATQSATRLRMAISLMGAPTAQAAKLLKGVGIGASDMAKALRSGGIVEAVGLLKDHLQGLSKIDQSKLLSGAFGGARTGTAIMALVDGYDTLVKKQEQIVRNSGKFGEAVAAEAETAAAKWHHFLAVMSSVSVTLGNVLLPIVTKMAAELGKVATAFSNLSPNTQTWIVRLAAVAAAAGPVLFIVGKLIGLFSVFTGIIGTVTATLGAFGAAFSVGGFGALAASIAAAIGPIGWVILGITAIGAAFVLAWKHSETFRNAMTTVWNGAVAAVQWAWSVIVPLAQKLWAQLAEGARWVARELGPPLKDLWVSMLPALRETWALVSGFFQTLYNGAAQVVAWFRDNWSSIGPILKAAWDIGMAATKTFFRVLSQVIGAIAALLRGDWGDAWTHVQNLAKVAMDGMARATEAGGRLVVAAMKGLAKLMVAALKATPGMLADIGKSAMSLLAKAITAGARASVSRVAQMPKEIAGALKALASLMLAAGTAAMRGLLKGLQSAWGAVVGFVKSVPGKIKGFFSGAGGWLIAAGAAVFNGLVNGMRSAGSAALAEARRIASGIKNAVTGFFGIKSPSTVMMGVGKDIALGLAHGIKKGQAEAIAAAADLAGNISSVLESALSIGVSVGNLQAQGMPTAKLAKTWAHKVGVMLKTLIVAMQRELKSIDVGKEIKGDKNGVGAKSQGWKADAFGSVAGMAGNVAEMFAAFVEITPETVAKALAGIQAAKAKVKVIAKAIGGLVKSFAANIKTSISEGQVGSADAAFGLASSIADILGTFGDVTGQAVDNALAGLQQVNTRMVDLTTAVMWVVQHFTDVWGDFEVQAKVSAGASAAAQLASDLAGIITTFSEVTAKTVDQALAGLAAVNAKIEPLTTAVMWIVQRFSDYWRDTTVTAAVSAGASAAATLAGDLANIITTFMAMTEKGVSDAVSGAARVVAAMPKLVPSILAIVAAMREAFKDVVISPEFAAASSASATLVGDIAGMINNLMGMTEKAIQDAIWGAGWVAYKAKDLGAALKLMVGWLAYALQGIDATSLTALQTSLTLLAEIASQIATIVNDLADMTSEKLAAATNAGASLGGGFYNGLLSWHTRIVAEANAIARDTAAALAGTGARKIPAEAAGGIFTKSTIVEVGEAGPEVILPLSRPARMAQLMQQAGLSSSYVAQPAYAAAAAAPVVTNTVTNHYSVPVHIGNVTATTPAQAQALADSIASSAIQKLATATASTRRSGGKR